MNKIREQINSPYILAGIGFLIGIIIGLPILGWGIWPVQWTDADPSLLQEEYRTDYMRMMIDSYSKNGDQAKAKQRWDSLGKEAQTAFITIAAAPGEMQTDVEEFRKVVEAPKLAPSDVSPTSTSPVVESPSGLFIPILVICLIVIIVGGLLIYIFLIRSRRRASAESSVPEMESRVSPTPRSFEETMEESTISSNIPVSQFMSNYSIGDDLFDDSFSIDTPSGEFLGECGVEISEAIGVGEPKKVSAFEVWLFDKNDVQTYTKVLMSEHIHKDQAARQRVELKGEPVTIEPGKKLIFESATLRLEVRVVDMNYGQGAAPVNSFFDRLTLELTIYQK